MMRMYRFLNLILVNKFLDYLVSNAAVECSPVTVKHLNTFQWCVYWQVTNCVSSCVLFFLLFLWTTDHRILHAFH